MHVRVAVERGRVLDERVGLQEPAERRVVDPAVHVDDAHGIHVLVAGVASGRDRQRGGRPGRGQALFETSGKQQFDLTRLERTDIHFRPDDAFEVLATLIV